MYPRCAFPGFRRPHASPQSTDTGQSWDVSYLPLGMSPYQAHQTSNVLIIEQSPRLPRLNFKGTQSITVAGRQVSLRTPTAKSKVFVAQWNTTSARYLVLANGSSPSTLERFIACLP